MAQKRKAQAVIFPEPGRVIIDEVDLPDLAPTDVLIEIDYSAISVGTEHWCLAGRMKPPGEPPLAFLHVPGYQAAGIHPEFDRSRIPEGQRAGYS